MCGRVSSMTYRDHPRVCGEHVLDRIDQYAKKHNRTRSAFLAESAMNYIRNH